MTNKEIADYVERVAQDEISRYGLPTIRHYDLSLDAGIRISSALNADVELVRAGIALMDIKLGQCAKEGKQTQHVQVSRSYGEQLLSSLDIDSKTTDLLLNCIEAHHGAVPFMSLEAEIVANADCYRFIHPRGVMSFHATVIKRGQSHNEAIRSVMKKLEEKHSILSLDLARKELDPYYEMIKSILNNAFDPEQ